MYGREIQQFDNKTAPAFKSEIERRLEKIGDEFGVSLKISNVKLNGRTSMNMTLTSSIGSEVKLEDTPSGRMFLSHCEFYGIPKSALGKTVTINRNLYRIIGWAPNARKYCVEGEQISSGKVYRLTTWDVKAQVT